LSAATAGAALNGIVASATSAGQLAIGGELRTFSFTAQKDSDNNPRSQAELFNRSSGVRVHMNISCLNIIGSTATRAC
jgi:hypothetical protein